MKRRSGGTPAKTPTKRSKRSDASMQRALGCASNTLDGSNYTRDEFVRAKGIMSTKKSLQDKQFAVYQAERVKQRIMWEMLKEGDAISSKHELFDAVERVNLLNASKSPMKTRRAALPTSSIVISNQDWGLFKRSKEALAASDTRSYTPRKLDLDVPAASSAPAVATKASTPVGSPAKSKTGGNNGGESFAQLVVVLGAFLATLFLPQHLPAEIPHKMETGLVALLGIFIKVLHNLGPLPQPQAYHNFADQRCLCCVPNFYNVVSNFGFVMIGLLGLQALGLGGALVEKLTLNSTLPAAVVASEDQRTAWVVFFASTTFIGFGSAYYHWRPTSKTLVWDRLPMTFAFMSALAVIVDEHLALQMRVLYPLLAIGVSSVVYWHAVDDLRPYLLVQFYPLLAIPIIMYNTPGTYDRRADIGFCLVLYVTAKFFEKFDRDVHVLTKGLISGHTLKHLWATAGIAVLLKMLTHREAL